MRYTICPRYIVWSLLQYQLTIAIRLTDILLAGLDGLIVSLVPTRAVDDDDPTLLKHWIGQLQGSDLHQILRSPIYQTLNVTGFQFGFTVFHLLSSNSWLLKVELARFVPLFVPLVAKQPLL